jgi:hypothetical protein
MMGESSCCTFVITILNNNIMKKALLFSISFFMTALVFANKEAAALVINYTKSDISCFGKQDGKIELSITGGKKPYAIIWSTGVSEMVLENLNKGTYDVTVRDASGKEEIESIAITSPSPLSIQYKSPRETFLDAYSGSVNAAISGGTPLTLEDKPFYAVHLNEAFGTENGYMMQDGIYTMKIEDSKGCSLTVKVNLDVEIIDSNRPSQSLKLVTKQPYNGFGYVQMSIYPTKALNQVVSIMETIER